MSDRYLIERAESCRRLALEERDIDLRDTLHFLAEDYRAKASLLIRRAHATHASA